MKAGRGSKIVLTGASGTLGRVLARELARRYAHLVLTDIAAFPDALPEGAQFVAADLTDGDAIAALCEGVDTIVHFGGINGERSFETILSGNIVGTHTIFEVARRTGARVVYASSNHATGFYRRDKVLDIDAPPRPDGLYAVSKVFGEALGRLYFDKHGIESVHLRIGSCLPEPTDERTLSTWLSYPDLVRLVAAAIETERTDFAVVWGVSANSRSWWRGDDAERIGFSPQDNAEAYADRVSPEPSHPIARQYQGGPICVIGYDRGAAAATERP